MRLGQKLSCADLGAIDTEDSGELSENSPGEIGAGKSSASKTIRKGILKMGKGTATVDEPESPRDEGRSDGAFVTPQVAVQERRGSMQSPSIGGPGEVTPLSPSSCTPSPLQEIAAYTPFWLWDSAATREAALSEPEVGSVMAGVMFADVSGFTKLTEALAESAQAFDGSSSAMGGAEQLTRIINRYFDKMIAVIVRYGGDVLKFAGDAMLVMFPAAPVCPHPQTRRSAQ